MLKLGYSLVNGLSVAAIITMFNFSPSAAAEQSAYMPPPPYFVNLQGETITAIESGQQIMIMNKFENLELTPRDYLGIIEVRNSQGVTMLLAWQTSTMPAANARTGEYGENTIGISWSAAKPGNYLVRAFAVTGFENPKILSEVRQSEIIVK